MNVPNVASCSSGPTDPVCGQTNSPALLGYSLHGNDSVWSPIQPGMLLFASITGYLGRQVCLCCSFLGRLQLVSPGSLQSSTCTLLFAQSSCAKGFMKQVVSWASQHKLRGDWEDGFYPHVPVEAKSLRFLACLSLRKKEFVKTES